MLNYLSKNGFRLALGGSWWGLQLLSLAGTTFGLSMVLLQFADRASFASVGVEATRIGATALAVLIAMIIQFAVGGFWSEASRRTARPGLRGICAAGGAALSVTSGMFAAAMWLTVLPASDDLAQMKNTRSLQAEVGSPLQKFGSRLEDIASEMQDLSVLMGQAMRVEKSRGASCEGEPVDIGPGPRWRLRKRLKAEAAEQAGRAVTLADAARETISVRGRLDSSAMEEILLNARAMARDPRLAEMRRWVSSTVVGFESQFFDEQKNLEFVCRDSRVVARLQTALDLLEQRIDLPLMAPTVVEASFEESIANSFNIFLGALGSLLGLGTQLDVEAFETTKPAFVAAGIVEFAIILLSLIRGALMPGGYPGRPVGRQLSPAVQKQAKTSIQAFDDLAITGGGETLLYVPEDSSDPTLKKRALAEVARWRMKPLKVGGAIDLSIVAPRKHDSLQAATAGARYFTVYRVPAKAQKWWREASIDLADAA